MCYIIKSATHSYLLIGLSGPAGHKPAIFSSVGGMGITCEVNKASNIIYTQLHLVNCNTPNMLSFLYPPSISVKVL